MKYLPSIYTLILILPHIISFKLVCNRCISSSLSMTAKVNIYNSVEILGNSLCSDIKIMAQSEITQKGSFYLAVPGGSVLKLLSGLTNDNNGPKVDWSKVYLFYVNHKCVPMTDPSATHLKAKGLFIDKLNIPDKNVFSLKDGETKGHDSDAHDYEKSLLSSGIPIEKANGLPAFDFMLLGVGKDGHIGSLYPGRKEVSLTNKWVYSVDKKSPASITLSLPIMNNAKETRVILMGADKAEAALIGITKSKNPEDFPVCGIKSEGTTWMIDAPCSDLVKTKVSCILK